MSVWTPIHFGLHDYNSFEEARQSLYIRTLSFVSNLVMKVVLHRLTLPYVYINTIPDRFKHLASLDTRDADFVFMVGVEGFLNQAPLPINAKYVHHKANTKLSLGDIFKVDKDLSAFIDRHE
jgi:hypothetical protein